MMSLLALATPRRKMPLLRRAAATAVVRAAAAATCGRRVPAQTRRLTTSPDMLALAQVRLVPGPVVARRWPQPAGAVF